MQMAAFSLREAERPPRVRRVDSLPLFFLFLPPAAGESGPPALLAPGVPVTILPLLLPRPAPEGRCRLLGGPPEDAWRPQGGGLGPPSPRAWTTGGRGLHRGTDSPYDLRTAPGTTDL